MQAWRVSSFLSAPGPDASFTHGLAAHKVPRNTFLRPSSYGAPRTPLPHILWGSTPPRESRYDERDGGWTKTGRRLDAWLVAGWTWGRLRGS